MPLAQLRARRAFALLLFAPAKPSPARRTPNAPSSRAARGAAAIARRRMPLRSCAGWGGGERQPLPGWWLGTDAEERKPPGGGEATPSPGLPGAAPPAVAASAAGRGKDPGVLAQPGGAGSSCAPPADSPLTPPGPAPALAKPSPGTDLGALPRGTTRARGGGGPSGAGGENPWDWERGRGGGFPKGQAEGGIPPGEAVGPGSRLVTTGPNQQRAPEEGDPLQMPPPCVLKGNPAPAAMPAAPQWQPRGSASVTGQVQGEGAAGRTFTTANVSWCQSVPAPPPRKWGTSPARSCCEPQGTRPHPLLQRGCSPCCRHPLPGETKAPELLHAQLQPTPRRQ